ncbi:MAG: OmpA family protein [Moraxellaceae bacterium]|nr:OmpA family protein [Moraxellaceae bacterium]
MTASLLLATSGCSSLKNKPEAAASATGTTSATESTSSAPNAANASATNAASTAAATGVAGFDANQLPRLRDAAQIAKLSNAQKLMVRTFYFNYDEARLLGGDNELLKAHAAFLKANPAARVQINGHTDERGTTEYNNALGERRAKAVASVLRAHGAPTATLAEVVSFGELKPADNGQSEEAWAANRRVELVYTRNAP